jgi:hypothetical protein
MGLKLAQNRGVGTEIPNVFNASVKNVSPGGGICLSKERIFKTVYGANQAVLKKAFGLRSMKKPQNFLALAKD